MALPFIGVPASFGKRQMKGASRTLLTDRDSECFEPKQSRGKCSGALWSQDLPRTPCREVCSKAQAGADKTEEPQGVWEKADGEVFWPPVLLSHGEAGSRHVYYQQQEGLWELKMLIQ